MCLEISLDSAYIFSVTTKRAHRGVSKREWLEAGLKSLSKNGIANLRVKGLAQALGIARAGFYWHFKNRDDLLRQLLHYWVHEQTERVTANADLLALEPKKRLTKSAERILEYDLGRYDMAIRQWALSDAGAARMVRKANRIRLDFLRDTFRGLGFTGDDLETRAMLFLCYHTWESTTFREISRKRRRELIAKRIELLTRR
jgi:AcrR family transcriptional regulator